jgi:hypothetical protein
MATENWNDDSIQFPRLLSELLAIGLPDDIMDQLAESMDLKKENIMEILARADRHFDSIKPDLTEPEDFPPGIYEVEINRSSWSNRSVLIDFNGEGDLASVALNVAGNLLFGSSHLGEYDVQACERISDRRKHGDTYYENDEGVWVKPST